MSANDSHIEKIVLQKMLDEARERERGYWSEIGLLKYRLDAAEEEIESLRHALDGTRDAALELDGMRAERDAATARVEELEGILHLIIRERNQERYDDGPVFEPVREAV